MTPFFQFILPARRPAVGLKTVCTPSASLRAVSSRIRQGEWGGGWAGLAMVVWLAASAVQAQPFAMEQSVISGGGGTSAGGQYALNGSLGAPDAGPVLTGGSYALHGGFWSGFIVIQTPGAPTLSIVRVGNTVEITWPSAGASGYVLQGAPALTETPQWVLEEVEPVLTGEMFKVVIPLTPGNRFFKLSPVH